MERELAMRRITIICLITGILLLTVLSSVTASIPGAGLATRRTVVAEGIDVSSYQGEIDWDVTAKYVDFVDSNTDAINIINQNLQGIKGEYNVTKSDYLQFLNNAKAQGDKYDIVLLDPPYNTDCANKAIDYIIVNNLLNDGGIIMYEKLYTTPFEFNAEGYTFKQKKYGTVGVVKIVKE